MECTVFNVYFFLNILGQSSASSGSSLWDEMRDLYWPWWLAIGFGILLLALMTCCLMYVACRRKTPKVNDEEEKPLPLRNSSEQNLNIPPVNTTNPNAKKPARNGVKSIKVKPFVQPKWNR